MTVENEFSDAFSLAFDADSAPRCIEVDWSCMAQEEFDALTPAQVERAELLAQAAIQTLTGHQVGNCPRYIRPCLAGCITSYGPDSPVAPYIRDGNWYNACGCRPADCSCSMLERVIFNDKVASIDGVWIDGVLQDPSNYRVDNDRELVRMGGDLWPTCQDMSLPAAEAKMVVKYTPGAKMDRLGAFAAGMLAQQFAYACTGQECRLPSYVQSMSRDGVTMDFSEGVFPGNRTGIDEVDIWVASWNPYQVKSPARVFSPDAMPHRQTTWKA